MTTVWILIVFFLGGCSGFLLFALLRMASQESPISHRGVGMSPLNLDTVSRL